MITASHHRGGAAAAHTKEGYLPAQYRRFLRRFGKKNENKAIFALAHTLVVIIWHLLANGCDYEDLGGDYFDSRHGAEARQRYLVAELEKLGQHRHARTSSRLIF